jgi:hypothetical protein
MGANCRRIYFGCLPLCLAKACPNAGQLDWWVKERQEWWGARAVRMAANGGSELLIFVRLAAHIGNKARRSHGSIGFWPVVVVSVGRLSHPMLLR